MGVTFASWEMVDEWLMGLSPWLMLIRNNLVVMFDGLIKAPCTFDRSFGTVIVALHLNRERNPSTIH